MKTQHTKILTALRESGEAGINSFHARTQLHIIQLPTRIKELKELGHEIISRPNSDRSVNYVLVKELQPKRKPEYDFVDGVAILKP